MIRRVFTIVATLAFCIAVAMAFYSDDSRFTVWHVGIVLHQDWRVAVRLPKGSLWEFNEMIVYVPAVACFLAAVVWNLISRRKCSQPSVLAGEPARAKTGGSRSRLEDWVLRCFYVFVMLVLAVLIIYSLTWHK